MFLPSSSIVPLDDTVNSVNGTRDVFQGGGSVQTLRSNVTLPCGTTEIPNHKELRYGSQPKFGKFFNVKNYYLNRMAF